jgi:citrate synthase
VEQVPENLAYGDLPQWDSLGHMDLMMALESRYGVQISTETIGRLVSLPEIVTYLSETSHPGKENQHA